MYVECLYLPSGQGGHKGICGGDDAWSAWIVSNFQIESADVPFKQRILNSSLIPTRKLLYLISRPVWVK